MYNLIMQDNDEHQLDFFHENAQSEQDDVDEVELAYALQNPQADKRSISERLVKRYSEKLSVWINYLLAQDHIIPTKEEIYTILRSVFEKAIINTDQFVGQVSVISWLFAICHQVVKEYESSGIRRITVGEKAICTLPTGKMASGDIISQLSRLPERLRNPLMLRYRFGFELTEISHILKNESNEVQKRLMKARIELMQGPSKVHMRDLIQADADRLLTDYPAKANKLVQHMAGCDECQEYARNLTLLEKTIKGELIKQWQFQQLSTEELDDLIQAIKVIHTRPKTGRDHYFSVRQIAWIVALGVMFVGLAIVFIRLTPKENEFPQPELTATSELPPIVNLPVEMTSSLNQSPLPDTPRYVDPAFSSDGKWAVFASIKYDPISQADVMSSINLYDHVANKITVISESRATLRLPWIWWNLGPSISADGERIAYVNASDEATIGGAVCETNDHHACMDIFIYQRSTGMTRRITHAIGGGAANGDSLAPTISSDGKWVAFWSAANNLVEGMNDACQIGETRVTCLYIYIADLETGKIEWIPVRIIPGEPAFGGDRISLSADGRYIGFTVTSFAQIGLRPSETTPVPNLPLIPGGRTVILAQVPQIQHSSEAVVFDRETGNFECENQAQDGTPGNGASSSPALSGDGRFVAFISDSTNLTVGDDNQYTDVFVRDRQSGKVELASVDSSGRQGQGPSGARFFGSGYYSLNISADGRYVAFESTASNLGQKPNPQCDTIRVNDCNILYVHDRQTGVTEEINELTNGDFSFFPQISTDGRWVSFMQSFYNCNPDQFFCSNVMLFDRQERLLINLTNYNKVPAMLAWPYLGSLNLPWESWGSSALAFSPDGRLLALGGYDSKIRVWDVPAGNSLIQRGTPDAVLETNRNDLFTCLAFNLTGNWLAAGTTNGTIYIWNIADANILFRVNITTDPVRELVFSNDGKHLVISTLNAAWIFGVNPGVLSKEDYISYGLTAVYALDISMNGDILATARGDGTVWLQSLPSGKVIGRIGADKVTVNNLAFSKDGLLLATRSSTWNINLWQIRTGDQNLATISLVGSIHYDGYSGALTFSPDNKYLASTGTVGEMTVWSIPDGRQYIISTTIPNGMVYSVVFSDAGRKLAVAFENHIALWSISTDLSLLQPAN